MIGLESLKLDSYKYFLLLEIEDSDGYKFFSISQGEIEEFKNRRAIVIYERKENKFLIKIFSKDVTSLRASFNSIARLLNLLESVEREILNI